ncbi:DUF2247 family protein [Kurthia senegalensis]|uniref:DUF2247 family protein n=1 Tax=Kurthia senegalensis TaxID=1033740 RepID=UPI000288552D|nr:DUF2247 family protein [Kurthia senegalensis]
MWTNDEEFIQTKPINVLRMDIPIEFLEGITQLSWTELYWGYESRYISPRTLIKRAEQAVSNDEHAADVLFLLASLFKGEERQVEALLPQLKEQHIVQSDCLTQPAFILRCKNIYLYAALRWLFEHPDAYNDSKDREGLLDPINYSGKIYDLIWDFRVPSEIAESLRRMVVTYEVNERNKTYFMKLWQDYLQEYEQFIATY